MQKQIQLQTISWSISVFLLLTNKKLNRPNILNNARMYEIKLFTVSHVLVPNLGVTSKSVELISKSN